MTEAPIILQPIRSIPDDVPAPEDTIGWDVLAWCSENLRQPDGPNAGDRWRYTGEQARIILRWYSLDSSGSAFKFRQGTIRRLKGAG